MKETMSRSVPEFIPCPDSWPLLLQGLTAIHRRPNSFNHRRLSSDLEVALNFLVGALGFQRIQLAGSFSRTEPLIYLGFTSTSYMTI